MLWRFVLLSYEVRFFFFTLGALKRNFVTLAISVGSKNFVRDNKSFNHVNVKENLNVSECKALMFLMLTWKYSDSVCFLCFRK